MQPAAALRTRGRGAMAFVSVLSCKLSFVRDALSRQSTA